MLALAHIVMVMDVDHEARKINGVKVMQMNVVLMLDIVEILIF